MISGPCADEQTQSYVRKITNMFLNPTNSSVPIYCTNTTSQHSAGNVWHPIFKSLYHERTEYPILVHNGSIQGIGVNYEMEWNGRTERIKPLRAL